MKLSLVLFACFICASLAQAQSIDKRDPLGEKAHYIVDKNSERTSSMVQSGTLDASVTKFLPDAEGGPAYEVAMDYNFKIIMIGNKTGRMLMEFPKEFFEEGFLEKLREDGEYTAPKFKMKHLGFKDAVNLDGRHYDHCDYVYVYDIVLSQSQLEIMSDIVGSALRAQGIDVSTTGSFENLEVWVHAKEGIPVLGGVKVDMKGKYEGQPFKVGSDYIPSRN